MDRDAARLSAIADALGISVADLSNSTSGEDTMREAWAALRMIRQAIEELGPLGVLPSAETVQRERGPMMLDEAAALVDGIRRLAKPSDALEPQK